MATFITLTRSTAGTIRVNPAHLAAYGADPKFPGATLYLAGQQFVVDVNETPEEIDALIADATAPTFTCHRCGRTLPDGEQAPDEAYGEGLCGDCWTASDRAVLSRAADRLR